MSGSEGGWRCPSKYHRSHLEVTGSTLSTQSTSKGETAAQNTISISSLSLLYMRKCQFALRVMARRRAEEHLSVSLRICLKTGSA